VTRKVIRNKIVEDVPRFPKIPLNQVIEVITNEVIRINRNHAD